MAAYVCRGGEGVCTVCLTIQLEVITVVLYLVCILSMFASFSKISRE